MKKIMAVFLTSSSRYIYLSILLLLALFSNNLQAETLLKVGVYNNKPTIFMEEDGVAGGVFIDILENIAEQEGWKLEYVPGHFSEVFEKLRLGKIDLLPAVAFSKEREAFIDFNYTTVMANWAELYTPIYQKIASFKDLEGKKIAVKQGDIHFQAIKELVGRFNISCRFFETDEYETVFEMLQANYVDVGVVNRLYGNQKKAEYNVEATPVIFNPIEMHYAAPETRNELVLNKIDAYLSKFKEDTDSIYYQSINRWLMVDGINRLKLPGWVKNLFFLIGFVSLFLVGATLLARDQVKRRTLQLEKTNLKLSDEIEQKKRVEKKLQKIARVVEASSDAVALVDSSNHHLFSNSSYLKMTAITQKNLEGLPMSALLGETFFQNELEAPVRQCLQGRVVQIQTVFPHAAEGERFWNVTLSPYYSDEKNLEGYVIAIRDVTEQVELERSLKTAQKMEAIGTMASGVAHDLNNILSGIVSYPELLRSTLPADSPLKGPLETIEEAGKRAAAVVSDLLTLARNAASVKEPTDVNLLITELLSSPEWKGLARQHPQVELVTNLTAEEATVNCSQVHIRKSLINLLNNGFEACASEGTVTISTINAQQVNTQNNESLPDLLISITDTGPGIERKHIEHIFEPFYTTKKLGKSGSGLGLSVVWSAIEEHNGSITVENLNPGVIFQIRLPVIAASELAAIEQSKNDIQSYRGTGKILVVDDEPELLEITGGIVKMLGYTVMTVASGEEALALLKEQHFDLILLDMILKDGMSGYDTYKKILEINPEQKAVIISGYASSEEVKKTLQLGASAIIKKPYTLDDLGKTIQKSLETLDG